VELKKVEQRTVEPGERKTVTVRFLEVAEPVKKTRRRSE
jgi:hypothetical protein